MPELPLLAFYFEDRAGRMIEEMSNLRSEISNTNRSRIVRILSEAEKRADEERRLELNYLRHLKRKYPDDDKRITLELAELC